jgi:peptidoglycan L-alanyl-D-glutamate endopeptidase CwlK
MTGFSFGERSLKNMVGVHPKLVRVLKLAIQKTKVDFMVIEGVRSLERQKQLYAQGRTVPGKVVTWTLNSNHFKKADGFGHAVDILPAPYDWSNKNGEFDAVAAAMFEAAEELDIPIRWGADWDRDGKPRERGETDSPHFELYG